PAWLLEPRRDRALGVVGDSFVPAELFEALLDPSLGAREHLTHRRADHGPGLVVAVGCPRGPRAESVARGDTPARAIRRARRRFARQVQYPFGDDRALGVGGTAIDR